MNTTKHWISCHATLAIRKLASCGHVRLRSFLKMAKSLTYALLTFKRYNESIQQLLAISTSLCEVGRQENAQTREDIYAFFGISDKSW